MPETRGIRNQNPGNIRHGDKWEGLAKVQSDPAFCTFISPIYGIRAMAIVLRNYQRKAKCKTLADFIRRWAPPNENDTTSYIAAVARECALTPSAAIDVNNADVMADLIAAIIRHENGKQPYTDLQIRAALDAAGITSDTAAVRPPSGIGGAVRQDAAPARTAAAPPQPTPQPTPILPDTTSAALPPSVATNAGGGLSRQPDQASPEAAEPETRWQTIKRIVGTIMDSRRVKAGVTIATGSQVPSVVDSSWESFWDWLKNDDIAVQTLWSYASAFLAIKIVGWIIVIAGVAWLIMTLFRPKKA